MRNLIRDIKKQVLREAIDPQFVDSGPIKLSGKSGEKMQGEFLVFSYTLEGILFQQWDVIVPRQDGQVFYVWAYTSPVEQYTVDLPFAKTMLASWVIE